MAYLNVSGLEHSYGPVRVLDHVSFSVAEGERLCLLGPSGCGKTTTLQVIAGFIHADGGSVEVAGRSIDSLPAEKRNIGIMFQNYALFPHLSIFENVAFGLRMRRLPNAEVSQRTADALRLVQLSHAAEKTPKQLSGGEQQRIAFARAITIRPSLLLLDEPFSNLDARLRVAMRNELLQLLRPLKIATVMVTHDQEEAMAIADRVAVMRSGRIEQIGTTKQIYDKPANLFVARFVGESNVFDGSIAAADASTLKLHVPDIGELLAPRSSGISGEEGVQVLVRPERILIAGNGAGKSDSGWNRVAGTVEEVMFLGHRTEWRVRVGSQTVVAWQAGEPTLAREPGSPVVMQWRHADTLVVPRGAAHGPH